MDERRKEPRKRTFFRALIGFDDRLGTVECVVRNTSTHGARLALPISVVLPNEFDVRVQSSPWGLRARPRWRSAEAVGVEFVDLKKP